MNRFALFVLGQLAVVGLSAQFPLVRGMDIRAGAYRPQVRHMAMDSLGLVWMASDRGILRTDGRSTWVVDTLTTQDVTAMATAGHGVVVATRDGTVLRCGVLERDTLVDGSAHAAREITGLAADGLGGYWLGTRAGGSYHLDPTRATQVVAIPSLPDPHVNDLVALPGGRAVIATDQGAAVVDLQGVRSVFGSAQGAPDELMLAMAVDRDGTVYLATDRSGIIAWRPGENTHRAVVAADPLRGRYSHLAVGAGRLWVASEDGVLTMHELDLAQVVYEHKVASPLTALMVDAGGAAWWATGSDRVVRASPSVLLITEHEGMDLRGITALCIDVEDRVWFSTADGLYHHATSFGRDDEVQHTRLDLPANTPIVCLSAADDGTIWAATFGSGALAIAADGTVRPFTTRQGLLNDNVLSVRCLGDEVWFGTLEGLSVLSPQGVLSYPGKGPGFVHDVQPLGGGEALAATDGSGLVRVAPGSPWKRLDGSLSTYYALARGQDGRLWATGPGSGICSVANDQVACRPFPGGEDASAEQLVPWGHHLLALGRAGIIALDPSAGTMRDLTAGLGMVGLEVPLNAVATDARGGVWTATDRGLLRWAPSHEEVFAPIPTVITGVIVGAESVPWEDGVKTAHDRNDITFRFGGVYFTDPTAVTFEYRLKGYDERILRTSGSELSYARLPFGRYVFQVRSRIAEGEGGQGPWTSVPITIHPPWYRIPWVMAAIGLASALVLVLLFQARERRMREKQRIQQERVRYELEALRSQVDPHFLFNSFNTLVALIETDADQAVGHVQRLSTFFRAILQFRDRETIELGEEMEVARAYFALEQERFGESIALDIDIPSSMMRHRVVPLTLQFLLENAFKHNAIDGAAAFVVRVSVEDDMLVVTNPLRPRIGRARSTGFGLHSMVRRYQALSDRALRAGAVGNAFEVRIPLLPPEG